MAKLCSSLKWSSFNSYFVIADIIDNMYGPRIQSNKEFELLQNSLQSNKFVKPVGIVAFL